MSTASPISPKVSILFATYNENAAYLTAALNSIRAQTLQDWELLVCIEPGDVNSEYFHELASTEPRIRPIFNPMRLGLAASLNQAASLARGEYLARMDSDDISRVDRLRLQASFLDKNQDVGVLGSLMDLIDEFGQPYGYREYPLVHQAIRKRFLFSNAISHPTVMMRQSQMAKLGFYNSEYKYAEDLELWLRGLSKGLRFANLGERLLAYRSPRNQFSKRTTTHWQYNLSARREHATAIWPKFYAMASLFVARLLTLAPEIFLQKHRSGLGLNRVRGVSSKITS